jgi:hypothetical protein
MRKKLTMSMIVQESSRHSLEFVHGRLAQPKRVVGVDSTTEVLEQGPERRPRRFPEPLFLSVM